MRLAPTAAVVLGLIAATPAHAQRDTTTRSDSAARADSIAREDSIRIVRELERIRNEPRARPEGTPVPAQAGQPGVQLLPNISAVGEVIADLSPDGSTQESGRRFDVREIELALQAAVDPYFRGDFFFGISDLEGFAIEEAYLSTIALPWQLQARAGRFHLPLGKQNLTHRPELLSIDYPYVIRRFLGEEGGKGTGIWLSKIFSPFGFYQEIVATVVDALPPDAEHGHEEEAEGDLVVDEPANKRLSGLGYAARLRNYWDLSQAANIEVSGSFATGRRAQPIACAPPLAPGEPPSFADECPGFDGPAGVNVRQGLIAADLTFRWRPLQQGLYRSFILQAEVMRQLNDDSPELPDIPGQTVGYFGPSDDYTGAYIFARYQLQRRWFVGARYDWLEDPELDSETLRAVSGYLQFFPSEFSKLVLGLERTMPSGAFEGITRLLLQATFAVGPHRPHAF